MKNLKPAFFSEYFDFYPILHLLLLLSSKSRLICVALWVTIHLLNRALCHSYGCTILFIFSLLYLDGLAFVCFAPKAFNFVIQFNSNIKSFFHENINKKRCSIYQVTSAPEQLLLSLFVSKHRVQLFNLLKQHFQDTQELDFVNVIIIYLLFIYFGWSLSFLWFVDIIEFWANYFCSFL